MLLDLAIHAGLLTLYPFFSLPNIRIIFVIGVPTAGDDDLDRVDFELQRRIEDEFQEFGDILQVSIIILELINKAWKLKS